LISQSAAQFGSATVTDHHLYELDDRAARVEQAETGKAHFSHRSILLWDSDSTPCLVLRRDWPRTLVLEDMRSLRSQKQWDGSRSILEASIHVSQVDKVWNVPMPLLLRWGTRTMQAGRPSCMVLPGA
jgi:hypothetical protein